MLGLAVISPDLVGAVPVGGSSLSLQAGATALAASEAATYRLNCPTALVQTGINSSRFFVSGSEINKGAQARE